MSSVVDLKAQLGFLAYDADNHYFEPPDVFIRHLDPALRAEVSRLLEPRAASGTGTVTPPGASFSFFHDNDEGRAATEFEVEVPASDYPEFENRDARLARMDEQGLEGAWMFPSRALGLDSLLRSQPNLIAPAVHAFNEWVHEDWGFAHQDRIFAVPFMSLGDVDSAITQLNWCLDRGARVITLRNGPVYTREGFRSPGDIVFDPFWARVQEADVAIATHVSADDGYGGALPAMWSRSSADEPDMLRHVVHIRICVPHFYGALVCHKVFERFPRLRLGSVENGGDWVPELLDQLRRAGDHNPGYFASPPADQFIEHVWVSPFWNKVEDLATHMPIERIVFGSDWPHGEGMPEPIQFASCLDGFSPQDVRRIIRENLREATGL